MRALWRFPLLGPAVFGVWTLDARRKFAWTRDWLPTDAPLLEVGSGPGSVLSVFRDASLDVTGLDIRDTSYRAALRPTLYDGKAMPFADGTFGAALLLTMLHHTPNPDAILREAARVARRLIVIEDVFENSFQRRYTKLADKLTNLEFFGHPHTNRDDRAWRATFDAMGLALVHARVHRLAGIFRQAVYVLDTGSARPQPWSR